MGKTEMTFYKNLMNATRILKSRTSQHNPFTLPQHLHWLFNEPGDSRKEDRARCTASTFIYIHIYINYSSLWNILFIYLTFKDTKIFKYGTLSIC